MLFKGFGEDLEQEAAYTEGWGMEANSSFEDTPAETSSSSSRPRKRKSTARTPSTSPMTVCITKRTKTEVKEEAFSDEEEGAEVHHAVVKAKDRKVKKEPADEVEEEDEELEDGESGGGKNDAEFVARLRRVNKVKSENVEDDECYQLRGWRSGRRCVP